jgi:ankyrin repeat protein
MDKQWQSIKNDPEALKAVERLKSNGYTEEQINDAMLGIKDKSENLNEIQKAFLWAIYCQKDINLKNRHGRTQLHQSACYGHTATSKMLIDHGADVNAKDKYGKTPLHLALHNDHTDTAKLLIERGGKE